MRVAWLAEGATWGPLTRAVAVLSPGAHVNVHGVVLAHRDALDNEPLTQERVPWRHVDCCTPGEHMVDVLAQTAADVIVADHCWRHVAEADGRPYVIVGMHGEGTWDLDSAPLHPWAWQLLPDRGTVRAMLDVDDDTVVVGTLSPWSRRNVIENALRDVMPDGVHMQLDGWGCARNMVGCDLVVASAGWSSTFEARWSGVPHCLIDVGGKDQVKRATHTYASARLAVAAARPARLPASHRAQPEDHVHDFVRALARLADGD